MADEPLDHVLRPDLPWRTDAPRTECGLDATSYPTITRDDLRARAKKLGQTRTYMVTCVTCLHTSQRWPTWDEDPVGALGRETNRPRSNPRSGNNPEFAAELYAIAALIEAHRDEFDEFLTGLADTASLSDARARKRREAR